MTHLGPYEFGRVYEGDFRDLIREVPAGTVQMIWTDPPYGNNNNNGDLIHRREAALGVREVTEEEKRPIAGDSPEEWATLIPNLFDEANRVLEKDSCCCCCCCCGGGGPKVLFSRVADWMDQRLQFFQAVVWDKGGLGMGWRYRRNYEFVMVGHRKGGKLRWFDDSNAIANVVKIGKIIPQAADHPTPKPVELVEYFLRIHTKPGDIVLDPFSGGGTTGVACKRMGRRFIGFEIDPAWVSYGNRRIARAHEQGGLFDGGAA